MERQLFVGFRLADSVFTKFYVVTLVETKEKRHIFADDFEAFFVSTGAVNSNAIMGATSICAEIIEELGFTLPSDKEASLCAS